MALTVKPLEKVRKNVPVREVAKSSQEELVRVNIEVEKETRQRWRTEAVQRGISLRELIQNAMERYLK
jgi:calcineurin-like phosphoesterase